MRADRYSCGTVPVLDVLLREGDEARFLYNREQAASGLDPVVVRAPDAVLQLQQHLL